MPDSGEPRAAEPADPIREQFAPGTDVQRHGLDGLIDRLGERRAGSSGVKASR